MPTSKKSPLYRRAIMIETIVCRDYLGGDCDAAELALDELRRNPDRSDETIAFRVALKLLVRPTP
jgi:hypothetical protein